MKQAVGYVRVSTEKQANEGASLEAQRQIAELGATNIILRSQKPIEDVTPRGNDQSFVLSYGLTHDDFADVPLDTRDLPPFFAAVYEALRRVQPGTTTTYGALGRKISGSTGAARAVGTAMAKNPFALLVPCHRVVGSDG